MATTVERVLDIAEATSSARCVVCGAIAECGLDLELAASGAVIDAASSKLVGRKVRSCRACHERQQAAKVYGKRSILVAIIAMPVVTLAVALLADRDDVIGALGGSVAGFAIASLVERIVARRRARRVSLLLLGADDESMMVQVNASAAEGAAAAEKRAAYREGGAPAADRDGDTPTTPHPPRSSNALVWAGSLMLTIVVCGIASTGILSPRRALVIDSPNDAVRVTIDDGEPAVLAAGGRFNLRVRSGKHRYRVEYVTDKVTETGVFDVSLFQDALLTTDASQCYFVWVVTKGEVVMHGDGRVRWMPLEDARSSERCER